MYIFFIISSFYQNMQEAEDRIKKFINDYNSVRPHQSPNGKTSWYGLLRGVETAPTGL